MPPLRDLKKKLGGICKAYVEQQSAIQHGGIKSFLFFFVHFLFASVPNGATYYKTRTRKDEGPHLRTGAVVVHLEFQGPQKEAAFISVMFCLEFPSSQTNDKNMSTFIFGFL